MIPQESGLRNARIVKIGVGLLIFLFVLILYKKFLKDTISEQKQIEQGKKQGSTANEYANKFHEALHKGILGEDEEECIRIAEQIGNRKLFNEVATAYQNLFNENLETYLVDRLDNEDQKNRFYKALGGDTKTNKTVGGGFFSNLFKF